jgi:VWFA-related protein
MYRGLLPLLTMVLLAGAAGDAQQPDSSAKAPLQPGGTFRSGVNVVEVHAVVTDERGRFVKDLSQDDFEIYEDGRLQKPATFALVDVPVVPPLAVANSSEPIEPDVRATSRSFDGRFYVIVLDDLHTMTLRSQLVREAAKKFIERHFGANDLAAIVYTSGRQDVAQELTSNRRLLRASVEKFQGQKLPSASAERLGVHMREREMNRAASESSADSSSSSNASPKDGRVDDPLDPERGFNARRALETVKNVAAWMTDTPSRRKALVLFSEGIDYDIYDVFNNKSATALMYDAREAIAAAQRANVSIYAVDPRGLTQLGDEAIAIGSLSDDPHVDYGTPLGFQRELLLAQESLMSLAEETGGMAIVRTNDIAGGLGRIVRDNSQYYVLGYATDVTRAPGKFRKIEVRVKRPGVQVRARRGYLPPDPKAAAEKRDREVKAGTSPALAAALNNPLPIGDLPVRVFAAPFRAATGNNGSILVAIEIDGSALKYEARDNRFTEKVEVSIVAADFQGKVRGTDRQTLDLKLRPETRQKLQNRGGVRLLSRIDVPPARYQLRVGVHESVGGAISTVPYDIEVPDYAKTKFALSGLVITSTGAGSLVTAKPDAQLKDVFPTPPIATRAFGRDETMGVFAELYDNSTPVAHSLDVVTSVRSTTDGRVVFNSRESRTAEAGAKMRTLGYKTEVPLRDLAPGTYVLRLEAMSLVDKQTTAFREIPFEVHDVSRTLTF